MLTKKDYIAIAKIINTARDYVGDDSCYLVMMDYGDSIIPALADYFANEDPNFDCRKFVEACGWQEG